MTDTIREACTRVREFLDGNDELRSADFEGGEGLDGHCYVASEAVFHLTGGYDEWYVCRLTHEGATHWFLESRDGGDIVDPTVDQFEAAPNYEEATRTGFMTSEPSKRAQVVLDAVQ